MPDKESLGRRIADADTARDAVLKCGGSWERAAQAWVLTAARIGEPASCLPDDRKGFYVSEDQAPEVA